MTRGVTLLELLVVIAMMGFLITGITTSYISALDYEERLRSGREAGAQLPRFEDRLSEQLERAFVSIDAADTTTYFIGGDESGQPTAGPASTLIFTTAGTPIPTAVLTSQDDFETLNSRFGPQGGVAEVSISTTAVGSAPNVSGLFIREQRPSDGDITQGGYERLFSEDVTLIEFEFFDGINWTPSWDTRTMTEKRIPSAIRVSYETNDGVRRQRIVRLPLSDVTPSNPITEEGTL